MKKKPENLSDPRVLLTEAGEAQWLYQLLNDPAAPKKRGQEHAALAEPAEAARRFAATKRPRKAA